jgi:hypothetical protein
MQISSATRQPGQLVIDCGAAMLEPTYSDDPDDQGDFQLPMLGLFADLESARGSVCLPDEFHQQTAATRASLLTDWIRGLEQLLQAIAPEADTLPTQYPPA